MVPTHMPFYCHPLSASVSMAMQGLTSVDIPINNKSVSMVRCLESGAAFVGWLDQKVPKYILGSEWAKRWCVVVSHESASISSWRGLHLCRGSSLWQQQSRFPKTASKRSSGAWCRAPIRDCHHSSTDLGLHLYGAQAYGSQLAFLLPAFTRWQQTVCRVSKSTAYVPVTQHGIANYVACSSPAFCCRRLPMEAAGLHLA